MVAVPIAGMTYFRTDYPYNVNFPIEQPIAFSHKHHVQGLGLDCRFCHFSVERTASAGMPDSKTCITCHSQIWKNSKMLEPVRLSYENKIPMKWVHVNRLPDYVYFNHSIHISKGVGCSTCHGDVRGMAAVKRVNAFRMKDCLACHRSPEKNLRPRDQIFDYQWSKASTEIQHNLALQYHIVHQQLTDCNHCHR